MRPSCKQCWYIAVLLSNNPTGSKTVERIWTELKARADSNSGGYIVGNYEKSIYETLKWSIRTSQEASYIIGCLHNTYSQSKSRLVAKFKEIGLVEDETEDEFMQDKIAMSLNFN